jgi:diaminopimelate epimerase
VIFACRAELPQVADIQARLFDPDGGEVELCGNGTACFTYWVSANGWAAKKEVKILTPAGVVLGRNNEDGYVRVCIPLPQGEQKNLSLVAAGAPLECDFVVTGVPHVITYVDDVSSVDVGRLGPALRHHRRFGPRGANANFVQVIREGELAVRTFEFGVEAETLSCGTGSAAAAIMAASRYNWPEEYTTGKKPILIHSRGGDVLRVYFARQDDGIVSDVCLETVVRFVYRGEVPAEFAGRLLEGEHA